MKVKVLDMLYFHEMDGSRHRELHINTCDDGVEVCTCATGLIFAFKDDRHFEDHGDVAHDYWDEMVCTYSSGATRRALGGGDIDTWRVMLPHNSTHNCTSKQRRLTLNTFFPHYKRHCGWGQ